MRMQIQAGLITDGWSKFSFTSEDRCLLKRTIYSEYCWILKACHEIRRSKNLKEMCGLVKRERGCQLYAPYGDRKAAANRVPLFFLQGALMNQLL